MVKCGETLVEREGHVKPLWDSLSRMVLCKLLNTCGWIFGAWLLLCLKFWSVRRASHHSAFMGYCRTISHTFYSPIYPVDEVNEDVGLFWYNILLFFLFGVNQVHCFGLKPGEWGEYLKCIVSVKIMELRGRLKCQQGGTPIHKFFWNCEIFVKDQWWERWKTWLGSIQCYLCFSWNWEREGSISSHCLYGQLLLTRF